MAPESEHERLMGTNYYYRINNCTSCGRFEDIHVGKRSGTWRAYPHKLQDKDHPEWGYDPESPFGFEVMSREDWRRVFTEIKGELWTEYKELIPDALAWLDEQKPWTPTPDGLRYLNGDIQLGRGWLDANGFKFYSGEFW